MVKQKLKVLVIEDDPLDVLLLVKYLKQYWAEIDFKDLYKMDDLVEALKYEWDIIISDFFLPHFDGLTALRMVREREIQTPFFLLSGQVSEDIAAAMMRLGANDYIMKDNMRRLAPAIQRELKAQQPADDLAQQPSAPETDNKSEQESDNDNELLHLLNAPSNIFSEKKITERHRSVVNILLLAELIKNHQRGILEKHQLTEQWLDILRLLKRIYPLAATKKLIKDCMRNKPEQITTLLNQMERSKLITFRESEKDNRKKEILLSPEGMKAVNDMDAIADEMFLLKDYISEQDAAKINEGLAKTLRIMTEKPLATKQSSMTV